MIQSEFIKHDKWLSEIIGKNAFVLNVSDKLIEIEANPNSIEHNWFSQIQNEPVFAFCKIDPLSPKHIRFVESKGFNLIDTNVTLKKDLIKSNSEKSLKDKHEVNDCVIKFAEESEREGTVHVARTSFIYSRFHLDPEYSQEIANEVKAKWVDNYFLGNRGNQMVIAKVQNEVVGFLQIIERDDCFIIDLIAVNEKQRGKKLAFNMIKFAEEYYSQKEYSLVGTQICNIPSIKLYQKSGFLMHSAKYVFHFHN